MSIQYSDIAPHIAAGLTEDAEIAAELAANPPARWFRPLASKQALYWLGGGGRMVRLSLARDNPEIHADIRGAIATTLIAIQRDDTTLDLRPGERDYNLLQACVAAEIFDAADVNELIDSCRLVVNPTAEQIARVRLQHKLEAAILAANSAFARGEDWEGIVSAFEGVG